MLLRVLIRTSLRAQTRNQPFTRTRRPPAEGYTLIHEHQAVGVQFDLSLKPIPAPVQNIGTILFGGMSGLFLRVSWWRAKKRHSVP